MSNEWDNESNAPEESDVEVALFAGVSVGELHRSASTEGTSQYDAYIDSSMAISNNEILHISAESDYECRMHGRVQSFRLNSSGYGSRQHRREVTVCLHCFMDLLSRECITTDSNNSTQEQEYRERMESIGCQTMSTNRSR